MHGFFGHFGGAGRRHGFRRKALDFECETARFIYRRRNILGRGQWHMCESFRANRRMQARCLFGKGLAFALQGGGGFTQTLSVNRKPAQRIETSEWPIGV